MVDARQNSLQDKIKRDCFHVRKNFRNEDNISVTLEWSCKEVYFQHQLTCPSHRPVSDKTFGLTFLHFRNDFPLLYWGEAVFLKKANAQRWKSLTFKSREIFIIFSPNSAEIDEQSFLSKFLSNLSLTSYWHFLFLHSHCLFMWLQASLFQLQGAH